MSDQARRLSLEVGDRVRIDIPDETHPDHHHHGTNGEIIAVLSAIDRSSLDQRQAGRFRVELDTDGIVDVRAEYLRPPI